MDKYRIAVIAGDGVGPEVMAEAVKVLEAASAKDGRFSFEFTYFPWGCEYYLKTGEMMPKDALELIPSLYLLTHDPREVLASGFFDDAVAWADTLPVTALGEIRDACYRQMGAMRDVLPEVKKKTSPATAGSRRSPTGRRASTAGAGAKSCGKSLQARSCSCVARSA